MTTEVETAINIDINTGNAAAELRSLQSQINAFQSSLNRGNLAQGRAAKDYAAQLAETVNQSKYFTAETVRMRTAAAALDDTLSRGRGTMAQFLGARFVKQGTAAAQVMQLANARAAALQTQFIATGAAANGFQEAMAIRPMQAFNKEAAVTTQRLAIQRAMLTQATTSMVNFGKNTQWAGRQLMVGFTVPLTIFGAVAGKTFMDLQKQILAFKKVYGDAFTTPEEIDKALAGISQLAKEYTRYGIAVKDTMELAANAAAAGAQGQKLIDATTQSTRLAVLGQMDQQEALKTTIALQNAFKISSADLGKTIDFLNQVENQTVVTLQDLAEAIPRVAPVIKGLGGNVQDLSAFLAAMQEGGVSAAQGANALKSGLASLINPTKKAKEDLLQLGINMNTIINSNKGDLMGTVKAFAEALSTLDTFSRQQSLEKLFGKYQYARLGALFTNIIKDGTQASRVMDIAALSADKLAQSSEKELRRVQDNPAVKFQAAMEKLKLSIAPIGEMFVKVGTVIVNFVSKIADAFNSLPDGVKTFAGLAAIITGVVVPAGTMFLGLLLNLTGTLIKFGHLIGVTFKGLITGGPKKAFEALTQSLRYMSLAEIDTANAAKQLGDATNYSTSALVDQAGAARNANDAVLDLGASYVILAQRMKEASAANAGIFGIAGDAMGRAERAPITLRRVRRGFGGPIPGSGNTDTVPAMLTPGEFVVRKEAARRNMPLLHAMNNPQHFAGGGAVSIAAMRERAVQRGMTQSDISHAEALDRILKASTGGWPNGIIKPQSATVAQRDIINSAVLDLFKEHRSSRTMSFRGVTAEDLHFIKDLPFGVGFIDADLNNLLRLGVAPVSGMIENYSRKGPLNPLSPLFDSRPLANNPFIAGQKDELIKEISSKLISRFRARGRANTMHDLEYYDDMANVLGEIGLLPLLKSLGSEAFSGARRVGFTTAGGKLAKLGSQSYETFLTRAFTNAGLESAVIPGLSGRSGFGVNIDGSWIGMASGKTGDISGRNSYQRLTPNAIMRQQLGPLQGAHFMPTTYGILKFAKGGMVPGYAGGGLFLGQIHGMAGQAAVKQRLAQADSLARNGLFSSMPITELGKLKHGIGGYSSTLPGLNGIYEGGVFKAMETPASALLEARSAHIMREVFGLKSPNQQIVKVRHPQTGQLVIGVLSAYDRDFAKTTGKFGKGDIADQIIAAAIRRDSDGQPDNFFSRIVSDNGASIFGVNASGVPRAAEPRMFGNTSVSASQQMDINMLRVKGGAKKFFATATAEAARSMSQSEYVSRFKAAIATAKSRVAGAVDGLPMATAAEKEIYLRRLMSDLDELEKFDFGALYKHHTGLYPETPKGRASKARKQIVGHNTPFRYGIPGFAAGGLVQARMAKVMENFVLENRGGLPILRNKHGNGTSIAQVIGKFQPFTYGHQDLALQTLEEASRRGADFILGTSLAHGTRSNNGLTPEQKFEFIRRAMPGVEPAAIAGKLPDHYKRLAALGYKEMIASMGDDRAGHNAFAQMASGAGMSLTALSFPRGDVSGTLARSLAIQGNFEGFLSTLPPNISRGDARKIYNQYRAYGKVHGYATGGPVYQSPIVPGSGSGDTVPAMLTPGEFVINKKATQKNLALLHAVNSGKVPGFALGGMLTSLSRGVGQHGMAASMGLGSAGGAMMMLPMVSDNAALNGVASSAGMALSVASMLPMLGPAMAPVVALGAIAAGTGMALKAWRNAIDDNARQAAKLGSNMGGAANAIKTMSDLLQVDSPAMARNKLRAGFTTKDQQIVNDQFSQIFESESGKKFIDELKNSTSAEQFKRLGDYVASAIAAGMMDQSTGQAFAKSVGLLVGNSALGAGVASMVRNQQQGSGSLAALAGKRADEVFGSQQGRSVLNDASVSYENASTVIGGAIQVMQDYSNVQALAEEEYRKGIITYQDYIKTINEAKSAQDQANEAILKGLQKSSDRGGTEQALREQLTLAGVSESDQDAMAGIISKGAESYKPNYNEVVAALKAQGNSMPTPGDVSGYHDQMIEDYKTQLSTASDSAVLEGKMTPLMAANIAKYIAENQGSFAAQAFNKERNGAGLEKALFAYDAETNTPTNVNASKYIGLGLRYSKFGNISDFQSAVSGIDSINRSMYLNNLGQMNDQQRLNYIQSNASLSGTIGASATGRLQNTQAYLSATRSGTGARAIDVAMQDASKAGVQDKVINYVINTEGSKSPEEFVAKTREITKAVDALNALPDQIISGLKIDVGDPGDVEKFGKMAEALKRDWPILQNLNPSIDMVASMKWLVNGGEATPDQIANNVIKLNTAFKNLSSGKASVRKQAQIDIAVAYAGKKTKSSEKGVTQALTEIHDKFKNFDKLDPIVATQIIQLYVDVDVRGAQNAAKLLKLKGQLDSAMGANGGVADYARAAQIMQEMNAANSEAKDIAADKRAAEAQAKSLASTSTGGGGGGGGDKQKSIIQELRKAMNDTAAIYTAMQSILSRNRNGFKNFIAGPFAPEFIEYLKGQGDRGLKILKEHGAKFREAYDLFQKQQLQEAANVKQGLGFTLNRQSQVAMGKSRALQSLAGQGVGQSDAESIVGMFSEGSIAEYNKQSMRANRLSNRRYGRDFFDLNRKQRGRVLDRGNFSDTEKRSLYQFQLTKRVAEAGQRVTYETNAAQLKLQKTTYENIAAFKRMGISDEVAAKLGEMGISADMSKKKIMGLANAINDLRKMEWLSQDKNTQQQDLVSTQLTIMDLRKQIATAQQVDPIQKEIDGLNEANAALDRQIELKQRGTEAIDDQIDKYNEQMDDLNEMYDKQIEALDTIEAANERIYKMQSGQLTIANALSRGDVAGAASAMQELQQNLAKDRSGATRDALELQHKNQIKQIQTQIDALNERRKAIENEIKNIQLQQRVNSDAIYQKQLSIDSIVKRLNKDYDDSTLKLRQMNLQLEAALQHWKDIQAWSGGQGAAASPAPAGATTGTASGNPGMVYNYYKQIWVPEGTPITPYAMGGRVRGYAAGGRIGTDTVPAMLTPGEFVVRKSAAEPIYPLLHAINNYGFRGLGTGASVAANAGNSGMQYTIQVNVAGTNASANEIADAVVSGINRANDMRLRSYNN